MYDKNIFTFMTESAKRDGFDGILIEADPMGAKITRERRLSGRAPEVRTVALAYDAFETEAIRCNFRGVEGWDLRCTSRGVRLLAKDQSYATSGFRRAA